MSVGTWVTVVIAAVAGLLVGAYATILIDRVPDDAGLRPAARCPRCAAPLGWAEMIPVVSYIARRGRCRHCGRRYGRAHLAAELVMPVVFVLLALRFGPSPDLAAFLYLAAAGVVLSAIDIAHHRLPDVLTKTTYLVVGGLFAIAVPHFADGPQRFVYALIGMAAMAALYFVLWLINPRGMAWGDVKLSGATGLALGWLGMSAFVTGLFIAFLLAVVYGVGMVVLRRVTMKSAIPFGPFMIIGTMAGILLSDAIHL